ncbi:hypothetical protein DFJ74DRAFT_705690 [Hyaloraphidium curvatum]|nr:hypothetical protein DFJ74DRAFT_705690 [Hyaloraphidium curvatum]
MDAPPDAPADRDPPPQGRKIFDAHVHIVAPGFPLVANNGYLPPEFTADDYRARTAGLGVAGGAVVSGSFQGFDTTYLEDALRRLGENWVGVAQLPEDVPDAEIRRLDGVGVRALRFNLLRGGPSTDPDPSKAIDAMVRLASRAHRVAGWHAEVYAEAAVLAPHAKMLGTLPVLVVDHLGMSDAGLPALLELVGAGARVKASGFGRTSISDLPGAMRAIVERDPAALVFGTDLPSTRAKRPFEDGDVALVEEALGPGGARRVFWENAAALYRVV